MCKVNFNAHVGCGKLLVVRPESISLPHRVDKSVKLFLQWLELGLPHPLTRRRVCPPLLFQGEGHTSLREKGWGVPIPTRGHTQWYSAPARRAYRSSLLLWWHLSLVYILRVNKDKYNWQQSTMILTERSSVPGLQYECYLVESGDGEDGAVGPVLGTCVSCRPGGCKHDNRTRLNIFI